MLAGLVNQHEQDEITSKDVIKNKNSLTQKRNNSKERSLYFCGIFYEESLPSEWQERLKQLQIDFAVSPLHQYDNWSKLDEEENSEHKAGTKKKSHYHIVLKFPSVKTITQVMELLKDFNQPKVQVCTSMNKYIQYFTHKNDPEKHQYSREDIYSYGIDIAEYYDNLCLTKAEEHQAFCEIKQFMRDNKIKKMRDVIFYADDNNKITWQTFFERYSIKSLGWIADGFYQDNLKPSIQPIDITNLAEQL